MKIVSSKDFTASRAFNGEWITINLIKNEPQEVIDNFAEILTITHDFINKVDEEITETVPTPEDEIKPINDEVELVPVEEATEYVAVDGIENKEAIEEVKEVVEEVKKTKKSSLQKNILRK